MDVEDVKTSSDARDLLRQWREDNVRQSAEVVRLYSEILRDQLNQLGEEKWMVLEQVAIAAMDVHDIKVVDECLRELRREFDLVSVRVRRLYAMKYEMLSDWEEALKLYNQILEDDETNSAARKRIISIYKQIGNIPRAVSELNKYLKDFMSDSEAWMELCDLYILEQEYAKAAFCCEELILHNPYNHIYFQRYAEIKYTQGGFENIEMAKLYYSKAVALNPNNMRALYGLLLTSSQLTTSPKCTAQKKKEYLKTVMWSSKQITKKYEEKKETSMPMGVLESLMGQMQVAAPQPSS